MQGGAIPDFPRSPPTRALAAVFAAACLAYLWFPSLWGWNENSRLGLVRAIVEQRTLAIDDYWQRPGNETRDASEHGGHVYSDKAIGTAVLGVPAYWAARPLLARYDDEPERLAHMARTLVSWVAVALPSAIACVALFVLAWRASGAATPAVLTTLAGALGTPQWPFATTLFGHATAGALLLVALFLGRELRIGASRPVAISAAIGAVLGLAAITEYPPALVAAMLGVYFLYAVATGPGIRSRTACVGAGAVAGLVPLGLLMAYNQACFGSPFTLSYAQIANPEFAEVHATGMLGVGLPDPQRLLYLTFHPARGVFAQSPILLVGLAGLVPMFRRRGWRIEAAVVLAAFVALLLVNAGFPVWWGGRSFAARHMVPALLLACLPIAFVARRWQPLVGALLVVSIVQMAIATAAGLEPPDDALAARVSAGEPLPWRGSSPIWSGAWQNFLEGSWRPTVGSRLGLSEGASLVLAGCGIVLLFGWAARAGQGRRRVPVVEEDGGAEARDGAGDAGHRRRGHPDAGQPAEAGSTERRVVPRRARRHRA